MNALGFSKSWSRDSMSLILASCSAADIGLFFLPFDPGFDFGLLSYTCSVGGAGGGTYAFGISGAFFDTYLYNLCRV